MKHSSAVVLLCAGSGSRMRGQVEDKILAPILGRPLIDYSIERFKESGFIDYWAIVYRDEAQLNILRHRTEHAGIPQDQITWVPGGKERQDSVFNALEALPVNCEYVFIHDSARPLISASVLRKLMRAVKEDKAAVLAHRAVDTMKQLDAEARCPRKAKLNNLDRHLLWAMETPQVFQRELIHQAYIDARQQGLSVTDDTAVLIEKGQAISLVENPLPNPKITYPHDLAIAEFILQHQDIQN